MTKFFFKKRRKTSGPMRSQVVGIAWIIAVLVAMMGWYFFSLQKDKKDVPISIEHDSVKDILEGKEVSAYQSKRKQYTSHKKTNTYNKTTAPKASFYTQEAPPVRKQTLRVELNSADTTTLQLLHGIGPAYARRIMRYRERLGGFVADTQLLEVYGFTPELLNHLRPHLTLDTTIQHRIAINSVNLKELANHPYIEYYQARDIINLRSKGIIFSSEEDLRAVPSMADSTLKRIMPYIDFALPTTE